MWLVRDVAIVAWRHDTQSVLFLSRKGSCKYNQWSSLNDYIWLYYQKGDSARLWEEEVFTFIIKKLFQDSKLNYIKLNLIIMTVCMVEERSWN